MWTGSPLGHLRDLHRRSSSVATSRAGATTWTSQVDGATVRIGNDGNQVEHAFRHTAELGLVNETVALCVLTHYRIHGPIALTQGQLYIGSVDLDGVGLEYTAFRVDGDSINIGRIIVP